MFTKRNLTVTCVLILGFIFLVGGCAPQKPATTPTTTHTITAIAEEHGSINPEGEVTLTEGENQTFQITPYESYHIADVLIDGESVGAVTSYTFENVTAHHTIYATFEAQT